MIGEELAALRALLSNLVFLARVPETLWRRIRVDEVCYSAGQRLAFTKFRGGKVGNGPAHVADWRIQILAYQITVRADRQDSDKASQLSRDSIRKAQACPDLTMRHFPQH